MEASNTFEKISREISDRQMEIVQQDELIRQIEKKKCDIRDQIAQLKHQLNRLPIGIHRLPDEVLSYICEHFLDFQSLLKSRQVCRRWFHVIRLKINSLVIYGRKWQDLNSLRGRRWFHSSNTLINTNSSIAIRRTKLYLAWFTSFNHPPLELPFLLSLRRLHVAASVDRPAWNLMNFVSKLDGLEELELSDLYTDSERPVKFWLTCPNLKYLVVSSIWPTASIGITSKVVKFKTDSHLSHFTFKHPDELRELALMSEQSQSWLDQSFSNLEVVRCARGLPEKSSRLLIEHSAGLKDLHLGFGSPRADLPHYESVKESALGALQLKTAFNRSELNIVFYGMKLKAKEQLSGFQFVSGDGKLIKLFMKNYPNLTDLAWFDKISYNHLVDIVAGKLPEDFHQKFSNIQEVQVRGVEDQDKLLEFLKNCKALRSLSIENASLDETFYREIDRLPIQKLRIDESLCKVQDFNYLLPMKSFTYFQSNLELPVRALQRGLNYLQGMAGIESTANRRHIKIEKDSIGFELTIDGNSVHRKTYTAEQLLVVLKNL